MIDKISQSNTLINLEIDKTYILKTLNRWIDPAIQKLKKLALVNFQKEIKL